ncbi:MAG: hypothetical protein NVSMB2_05970 [Chloroflexota bacterium]
MLDSPEVHVVSGTPWLMTWRGLAIVAALGVIAAALAAADLAFIAACLFVAGLFGVVYAHAAFWGLRYARALSSTRAFCGESVILRSSLANPRPLPLPWIEVWECLPETLVSEPGTQRSFADPRRLWTRQGLALWPYRRARWQRTLTCSQRGVMTLGPVRLRTGDPIGLVEREHEHAVSHAELIVYPRVVPLRTLGLHARDASVDIATPTSLVVDPTRTAAVRDYRPGDARRTIHWPASAHRGNLQVRVLEPATSLRVSLVMDTHGFLFGAHAAELFELTLSALASIAVFLHSRGSPVGLVVNGDPPVAIAPGSDVTRLQAILEALARLQPRAHGDLLPWAFDHIPGRASIILATAAAAAHAGTVRNALETSGFAVHPLVADDSDRLRNTPHAIVITPGCDLTARVEGRP